MNDKRYPVIEIFGPTIQGEGAMAGRPTHFIRMGGCDYRCAWCDSGYAVLPEQVRENAKKLTTHEILGYINDLKSGPRWVTISGGNPALHNLIQLVDNLHLMKFKVAVETQGSLWKNWLLQVDQLTISPKPPSSGMQNKDDLRQFIMCLEKQAGIFYGKVCLKIPVLDEEDYEYAIELHSEFPRIPFYFSVVTLMGGLNGTFAGGQIDTRDDLLERYRWLAERVAADNRAANTAAIPQLHALLWGHGRGF
jgi:7-carboxy-7-deazaguanine synthase